MNTRQRRFRTIATLTLVPALSWLMPLAPASAAPTFKAPFACKTVWGASTYPGHGTGIDFNMPGTAEGDFGKPVLSSAAGTVVSASAISVGGNRVVVDHGTGWTTYYGHLNTITAKVGQRVVAGTQLGTVGRTGAATGSHVHYEQRYQGAGRTVTFDGRAIAVGSYPPGPTFTSTNCGVSISSTQDLYFIKTRNTGTGRIEIHNASATSGYKAAVRAGSGTRFSAAERANGYFQIVGTDLYFIKTRNTGTGRVEVHNASSSSGYKNAVSAGQGSRYAASGSVNGYYQVVGKDLYFIKVRNTGTGRIEVHGASATSGYKTSIVDKESRFAASGSVNGYYQLVGKDLYFIKVRNTSTGRVEVHNASAASGYTKAVRGGLASRFSTADAPNGYFQLVGTDLYFIKTRNTGTGKIEVHNASTSSGYKNAVRGGQGSRFVKGEAANGYFQIRSGAHPGIR